MTAHILVVNSDPAQRRQIKSLVETQGHVVHAAENAASAFEKMVSLGSELRVALLDLTVAGLDVNHFLSLANQAERDAAVVVLADDGKVDAAVDAMRHGAFDFIVSPAAPERIAHAVSNALRVNERRAARPSRRNRASQISFGEIVAASSAMTRVVDLARRSASSAIPVILEGENGVGKQMVARAIHCAGDRSNKPFVAVSCGAMTPESLDAMLFGEEGGDEQGRGKIASAHGGTLFLDEVDALPLDVQARLLQLVQGGEISSHDGRRQRKVDVRLTSSTRKDLIEEVKAGRFREDLYFRMNVFPIMIPALRRRRDDIPYLARAFVERFSAEQRRMQPLGISADVLALLTSYDWPGNVRQLENAVYRAVILSSGNDLTEADFPQIAIQVAKAKDTAAHDFLPEAVAQPSVAARDAEDKTLAGSAMGLSQRDSARLLAAAQNPAVLSENYIVSVDSTGNVRKLAEIEEELIRFALKYYRGQMSQVARKLGIGRSTLYRKLKDYDIDPDNPQSDVA